MQKTVDCHVHLSEDPADSLLRYAKLNGLKYTLEELLAEMRRNGVMHGLLLSPPLDDGAPLPNEDVIALCRRSHGSLSPIVTVEPTKKEVSAAVRLAEAHRDEVKGFKVRLGYVKAPADSPIFGEVYDYAQSKKLPVLFHTGDTASSDGSLALSHPLNLDRLANARDELRMVLCHFGNPWFEDAAELIYKHPNLYADISGLTTGGGAYGEKLAAWIAKKVSEAVYFAGGADKVLFGTDYPVTRHSDALKLVSMMEIDEADKESILWRNAEKVFSV
jgi:uncharacterized protein